MIENDHEPDLGALIKQGYSSPLPEEPFVESLWASLCRELPSLPEQSEPVARLPRRRPAAAMRTVVGSVMRHRRLALAAAAAVVVALLALPFVVPRTTDEQSGGAGVPSGEANMLTAAPQPSKQPVRPPSPNSAGERRPEADVAEASVIVRARATGRTRATVEYRVTKVFKGKLTEDLITVQIPEARAGAPYDAEKKYAIGQEVILFLSGFREGDKRGVWNAFTWWYDVPPSHRLDDREKIILAAIAKAPPADADALAAQPNRIAKGRTRGDGRAVLAKSFARTRADAQFADRARTPDKAKIEAEAKQIAAMARAGDIDGLVKMLSVAEFVNKVVAAEKLGEIGDQRALVDLEKLNRSCGGWWIGGEPPMRVEGRRSSGAFAWAIWKTLHRDLPEKKQIESLFDLLDGKGRAVPDDVPQRTVRFNFDVGRRVGRALERYDDPAVVARLRRTKNKGAAISAVKMEVRGMEKKAAIARCLKIARQEADYPKGAGGYGAIQVLGTFGAEAFDALDELAGEGHHVAITVLGYHKEKDPKALQIIYWHLVNNSGGTIRYTAANHLGRLSARPGVVPALIKAMYDPQKSVRRNAASSLSFEAYRKNTPHLQELEEAMLMARRHPDQEVRQLAMKALERLGSKRLDEPAPDPPPIRTIGASGSPSSSDQPVPDPPAPPGGGPARWDRIDTSPILVAFSGKAIVAMSPKAEGRLPLSTRVAKSSAVVRCTMIELTDTHLVCQVTRVIYGRVPGDLLRVRNWGVPDIPLGAARLTLRRQLGREPTRAELQTYSLRSNRFRVGRDVILFLDQCRQTDAGAEFHCVALRFDQGLRDSLDDCDKKIMELVTNGTYLMPKPTIFLDQYLMASERVVRAELKKIGGTSGEWRSTEWRVTGVVHVTPPGREGFHPRALTEDELEAYAKQTPATIRVGLDPWRLRAEAIVRYRATQEPGQAPTEERIQAEFTRLVGAELTVGQEAILMLRPRENARGKDAYKLVGIVRSGPDKARNVDQLEKTIREMITKGFPKYL